MAAEQKRQADPLDEWSDRDYPVAEDMDFQRATWMTERIGWVVVVILMLLALAGLFSVGPLSSVEASDDSGALNARYEYFHRAGAGDVMELTLVPLDGSGAQLRFDSAFLRAFTIEQVQPEPREWRGEADGAVLVFPPTEGRSFTVQLSLLPEIVGPVQARISLDRQAQLPLSFFIYP